MPNRKRPLLCVEEENKIVAVGSFYDAKQADWLMDKIAEIIGQTESEGDKCE